MQTKQKQKILKLGHGHFYVLVTSFLFFVTVLAGILLRTTPTISRANAVTDADAVTGSQEGCSFTGTVSSAHSATISIGESEADFGTTKITTVCANSVDHQVYAVGFTNETEGNTNLVNTNDSNLLIPTGIETGNISNWSMKISKDTTSYLPENLSIENNFSSNHVVPDEPIMISSYTGGTDGSTGSSIFTTYSANTSNTQVKGEYTGKVKYTLTATMTYSVTIKTTEGIDKVTLNGVECTSTDGCVVAGLISGQSYTLEVTPSSGYEFTGWNSYDNGAIGDETVTSTTYTIGDDNEVLLPEAERLVALLDTGTGVNIKMKNTASNISYASFLTEDTKIKAIQRSDTLPNGFIATTNNTISLSTSNVPIYIFFDDTNSAGIMYYYAENNATIILNRFSDSMFKNLKSLQDITGLANWNTSEAQDISGIFSNTKITNIDVLDAGKNGDPNNWNTGNVTNMSSMFYNCSSLTDITGLSKWDTANVTNMNSMLSKTAITDLNALATGKNNNPNIWNTGNVTDMSGMFQNTSTLADISGISNWDTSKVNSLNATFSGTAITDLNALATGKNNNPNIWNTGNVTNMSYMFQECSSLTDINGLSNWDTSKVTSMNSLFKKTGITNVDALATGKNNNPNIWNTGSVKDMSDMFLSCSSLTDITGLSNWDTAKVTSFYRMFYGTKINNLDALVPGKNSNPNIWNTGNATNISDMFYDCSLLSDITGLSNWDTAKVTDMSGMFTKTAITNVDALIPGKNSNPNIWNTGIVTTMGGMFSSCSSLTDITGLSYWDTTSVTSMTSMFVWTGITNVDALATGKNGNPSIWNTGNVKYFGDLFNGASSLADISGLSNWDTSKAEVMKGMFANTGITSLGAIINWDVNNVTATIGSANSYNNNFYNMFYGIPSTITSGFSFTNRAGTIDGFGTYIPSS